MNEGSAKTAQNHPKASATHLQLLFFRYGTRMEAQGRLGSEWESDWELQIAGKAHIIARKNAPERERGRVREEGSEASETVGWHKTLLSTLLKVSATNLFSCEPELYRWVNSWILFAGGVWWDILRPRDRALLLSSSGGRPKG